MKTTPTLTLLRDVEAALLSCKLFAGCEREYDEQLVEDAKEAIQELVRRAGEVDEAKLLEVAQDAAYAKMQELGLGSHIVNSNRIGWAVLEAIRPHLAPVAMAAIAAMQTNKED